MDKYFNVLNLDLSIDNRLMLSSLSFSLDKNVCILGESGSGKSLLLKKLLADSSSYQTNGNVSFYLGEGKKIVDWKKEFSFSSLENEIQLFLETFFKNQENLEKKYALVKKILEKPNFLLCEDLPLSKEDFLFLLEFLKKENIFLFMVTNDIEKTIYFDYLIVIKNNKIAIEGKTMLVLKEEKLMKLLGFSLPFYVNMSIQLRYYGLVSEIYLNKIDLERALWH